MANIKISELEEMTETKDNDLLVIVDSATDTTKKIKGKNAGFGGGTYIGTEQPTKESYNVWINPDEITLAQQQEEIYTEEEQVIGTFLGKPLYRKTIRVNDKEISSSASISTGITNIESLISLKGFFDDKNTGTDYVYPLVQNSGSVINCFYKQGNILFNGNETYSPDANRFHTFTLEYTKSTD